MKLCVQTALSQVSIALIEGDVLRAERSWESKRDEGAKLLPEILAMLKEAEVTKEQLTGLVGITGPGSFTALRVGLSVLNTMAYVLQIPMYGTSSFHYLEAQCGKPIDMVCMSSGANECFLYHNGEAELCTIEEVKERLKGNWTGMLLPMHQHLQERAVWHAPEKSAGETWQTLVGKGLREQTTILVPAYLKQPNITTRKTR